jgi:hypothetical protein
MHWFDSMGSPAEVFKGAFNGDVLTVSHGGPMHARMTYDFSQGAAKNHVQDGNVEGWQELGHLLRIDLTKRSRLARNHRGRARVREKLST